MSEADSEVMTRFGVTTSDEVTTYYRGTFGFKEGGVLMVVDKEAGATLYFSPNHWLHIEDTRPRKPGRVAVVR